MNNSFEQFWPSSAVSQYNIPGQDFNFEFDQISSPCFDSAPKFFFEKFGEIYRICKELDFSFESILVIAQDIIREVAKQGKFDVVISKTGEDELLIYRRNGEGFTNIILDSDADIQFINISGNRASTTCEFIDFIFVDDNKIAELVSKL